MRAIIKAGAPGHSDAAVIGQSAHLGDLCAIVFDNFVGDALELTSKTSQPQVDDAKSVGYAATVAKQRRIWRPLRHGGCSYRAPMTMKTPIHAAERNTVDPAPSDAELDIESLSTITGGQAGGQQPVAGYHNGFPIRSIQIVDYSATTKDPRPNAGYHNGHPIRTFQYVDRFSPIRKPPGR